MTTKQTAGEKYWRVREPGTDMDALIHDVATRVVPYTEEGRAEVAALWPEAFVEGDGETLAVATRESRAGRAAVAVVGVRFAAPEVIQ